MANLGLFAFGIVVGSILLKGVKFMDAPTFTKTATYILTSLFSGTAIKFIASGFNGLAEAQDALWMYPVGLLIALLWIWVGSIIEQRDKVVKVGGLIGLVAISACATALCVPAVQSYIFQPSPISLNVPCKTD